MTSTRFRKHLATIMQFLNFEDDEIDQIASFMGHTRKTHDEFYRLPQDVYQTSKVAKILMIMNKGKGEKYRGKALAEIDVSAELESSGDESEKEDNVDDPESMNFSETVVENDDNKTTTIAKNTRYESPGSDASEKGKSGKKTIHRKKWTKKQKELIEKHFAEYIKRRKAPNKKVTEDFRQKNIDHFGDRTWTLIKAYVYNCHRK